jgi:transketolase
MIFLEKKKMNNDLRIKIAKMVFKAKEGHIPSSFSIVDIVEFLYGNILRYDPNNMKSNERDYFILSKGHGAAALYAVLHKYGILSDEDIENYSLSGGILGGHPDMTKVPGAEASTGSLGHGFPTAMGVALGLKIQNKNNHVYTLLGDGECHEGTIWESANVANNLRLGNFCAIVDWNGSASQLMPLDNLIAKWSAFGWEVHEVDGHSLEALRNCFGSLSFSLHGTPKVILAKNIKGSGVKFLEGHGQWHHKIPSINELDEIIRELSA